MKTNLILSAAMVFAGTVAVQAEDAVTAEIPIAKYSGLSLFGWDANPGDLFRNSEISLEAFGAVAGGGGGSYYGDFDHVRAGGGGGAEIFFARYVGVELEAFALGDHNTATLLGGNLVLRYPLGGTGFSPYIFGGGGNDWTYVSEGYGDGGAGLEYRINSWFSVFGDGRYVGPGRTRDFGMGRFGVKFNF